MLRGVSQREVDNIFLACYIEHGLRYIYRYSDIVKARRDDKALLASIDASGKRMLLAQINTYLSKQSICAHVPYDKFKCKTDEKHAQILTELINLIMRTEDRSLDELIDDIKQYIINKTGVELNAKCI